MLTFACGMATKHGFGCLRSWFFQLLQAGCTIEGTGSKVAVVKRARRVLAFVFDVLDVVAQAFFIGPELAVTAQAVLFL